MFVAVGIFLIVSASDPSRDLLDKISSSHASYDKKIANIEFTASVTSTDDSMANLDFNIYFFDDYCKQKSAKKFTDTGSNSRGKSAEKISCVNGNSYMFNLKKQPIDGQYVIVTQSRDTASARSAITSKFWRHIKSPIMIRGRSIREMLKHKDCSVTIGTPINGNCVLDVSFRCAKESDKEEDVSFVGKLYLNGNYLIDKYDLALEFRFKDERIERRQVFAIKYHDNGEGMLPVHTLNEIFDMTDKRTSISPFKEEWRISGIKSGHIDPSMFTLTYYGFPEPPWLIGAKDSLLQSFPWFLLSSIAGVVCLILASYILYRRGKAVV